MSNIAGHLLKFKDENGNWISIPITTSDIYNMYVQYCEEHSVEPVTQEVYYQTLGSLQDLVSQLAGSADAMSAMANALGSGALPTAMGGLGITISDAEVTYVLTTVEPSDWNTNYTNYYKLVDGVYTALTEAETWAEGTYYSARTTDFQGTLAEYLTATTEQGGLNLTTNDVLNITINNAVTTLNAAIALKADKTSFSYGTSEPTSSTAGTYYFQYKN